MNIHIITLFPEAFPGTLGVSLCGRSQIEGKWKLNLINIRDYGIGIHKDVDDYPFGGGAGMLMRADVLASAIESINANNPIILLMSAAGYQYNQSMASKISTSGRDVIIICGRFEGVDSRIMDAFNIIPVSIGPYVIFGGESAAMVVVESMVRLIEGVCGNDETVAEESFAIGGKFENLMEYRQYTKPREWNGLAVPEVLVSGNHQKIAEWRMNDAVQQTAKYTKPWNGE